MKAKEFVKKLINDNVQFQMFWNELYDFEEQKLLNDIDKYLQQTHLAGFDTGYNAGYQENLHSAS